jgi:hypothetical protein
MNIADLAPSRPSGGAVPAPAAGAAMRAVVADPAPTSTSDPLYVYRPDVDQRALVKCRWTPMHGLTLPAAGANALVQYDNTGAPYAVWWDGQPTFPAPPTIPTTLPPSGAASGDLQGSYPAPTVNPHLKGLIFDTQRTFGANNAYVAFGNGTNVTSNAAQTTLLSLTITPPVDCWWEVDTHVGIIDKTDAAWTYAQLGQKLTVPDVDGRAIQYDTVSDHSSLPYMGLQGTSLWKLAAGTAYTAFATFITGGGTWTYYQGADYLRIYGKAWAR